MEYKDRHDKISKWADYYRGRPEGSFSIANTPRCNGERYSFPWMAPLTLDSYLLIMSGMQGGIKYYFLSLWYYSTWD